MYDAFAPARLNGLALRNRVVKTATFEGMSPGGVADARLAAHHAELARGGVGLTTVAYAAVAPSGRTFSDQLLVGPATMGGLRAVTAAVHAEGGAVAIQLAHCGGFTKDTSAGRPMPRGPSWALNAYGALVGRPLVRSMPPTELDAVPRDFATAAARTLDAGFDAIELHLGHGYLLSQFLSPLFNRRRDGWGGDLEGRLRLPLAVVREVRQEIGPDVPLLGKVNLEDGLPGGSTVEDAARIVTAAGEAGLDAVVLSGGLVSRNAFYLLRGGRPLREMIRAEEGWAHKAALATFGPLLVRPYAYEPMYFLDLARAVRRAVGLPLVLLGGLTSRGHVDRAMTEGFDFVAMGRALVADPDLVHRMAGDPNAESRCDHCNLCVAEMSAGVRCACAGALAVVSAPAATSPR